MVNYRFSFFFNLVEKNSFAVKKISKCRENGIDRLRNGNLHRRAIGRLKGEKTPSPPPSPGGKSLDSILQTLEQMQTEMTKTSERISTMETLFEQLSNNFFSNFRAITVLLVILAYSDEELLDYSEDDVSLATGPQEQAIKPNYKAIKPNYRAIKPNYKAIKPS